MVRIGKLTGRQYDETIQPGAIGECCHVCNTEEEVQEALKVEKRIKDELECAFCRGCPEYQKEK